MLQNQEFKKRLDVVVDIETLGTDIDAPIIQCAIVAFDIKTTSIMCRHNCYLDANTETILNNVSLDTLRWWLSNKSDILQNILCNNENNDEIAENEKELIEAFCSHITAFTNSGYDVYLWGNGPAFDNAMLAYKCKKYGLKYPVKYTNDRCMRTILELAADIAGFKNVYEFRDKYKLNENKNFKAHNAAFDVEQEAYWIQSAYKIIKTW